MARGPWFGLKASPNPRRRSYRAAVVVSRKVNKSAVARNRIRRRLYEALRQLESDINGPYDIVITVFNDNLLAAPFGEITGQLKKLLKQLDIIK